LGLSAIWASDLGLRPRLICVAPSAQWVGIYVEMNCYVRCRRRQEAAGGGRRRFETARGSRILEVESRFVIDVRECDERDNGAFFGLFEHSLGVHSGNENWDGYIDGESGCVALAGHSSSFELVPGALPRADTCCAFSAEDTVRYFIWSFAPEKDIAVRISAARVQLGRFVTFVIRSDQNRSEGDSRDQHYESGISVRYIDVDLVEGQKSKSQKSKVGVFQNRAG